MLRPDQVLAAPSGARAVPPVHPGRPVVLARGQRPPAQPPGPVLPRAAAKDRRRRRRRGRAGAAEAPVPAALRGPQVPRRADGRDGGQGH